MPNLIKRIARSLVHPADYFKDMNVTIWDGVAVICLLFLVSFFQKLVWVETGSQGLSVSEALKQAALNSLLVWCLFCVFYFAIAGIFRRNVNLPRLSGWVGAAGLPVVLATLVSALSWLIAGAFHLVPDSTWMIYQNGLSWLGLLLSWPGLLGYSLLENSLNLRRIWAILLPLAVFLLLILGRVLPLLGSR
jgi:hypothetical protein